MSEPPAASVYETRGFGGRQGPGTSPALVIVDLINGFTDPRSPLHCETDQAVVAVAALLAAARAADRAVVFTTVQYDEAGAKVARAFIAKAPALLTLTTGSYWTEVDARIAPRPGELVVPKLFASAFFGTPLSSLLAANGCDTVIVTGASTSGCVRATAVDALQHGYRVIVPREGVADRAASAHQASLLDLDAKYADVVGLDEAVATLRA